MSQLRTDQTARNLIVSIGSRTILKLRPSIKTNTYKDERSIQIIVVFLLKVPVVPFHFSSKLVVEFHSGVNPTIWWGVRHGDESGRGQPAGRFGCRSYIRTGSIPQVPLRVVYPVSTDTADVSRERIGFECQSIGTNKLSPAQPEVQIHTSRTRKNTTRKKTYACFKSHERKRK